MQWPRRVEHVLKGDSNDPQQGPDAGVGVGHDGASFVSFLLALHHDVAAGWGLLEIEDLLVLPGDVLRQVLPHVVLDGVLILVHDCEGVLVKPGVEGCLIVQVGAGDHEVGVGVVFVVDDVVVGNGGEDLFDVSFSQSRLMS